MGIGTPQVMVAGFGEPAFAALRDALAEFRGGDPMAPVDVAVPSSFCGLTVRRRLAVPGLAGVRFAPLPLLIADRAAPALAASAAGPLTAAQRRAAVRAVLAASSGRLADSARRSASTAGVVAGVFAELDDAAPGEHAIRTLTAAGGWPAELAGLYLRYLDLVARAIRPAGLAELALTAPSPRPLIVYLPRRLTPVELRFCAALAARGRSRVILGLTGDEAGDRDALAIIAALAPSAELPPPPAPCRAQTRALPDAEEEARYAVRRILDHLGRPGSRADRVAVAYRATVPYARLVSEQLSAAGLPHHAPQLRSLAQTVPGRTLLGLLRLPGSQWSRVAVLGWLREAPVRDGGGRLPVARWQRQAAEAGITRGQPGQWAAKLERLAVRLEQRTAEEAGAQEAGAQEVSDGEGSAGQDAAGQDAARERAIRFAERAASARGLAAFVTDTAHRVGAINTAATWSACARLLREALVHYLGGTPATTRWGRSGDGDAGRGIRAHCDAERRACEETLTIIDSLAGLDDIGMPLGADTLSAALEQELGRPARDASGLGRGVLVGPLWDVAGADLDLLVIVGAAEGSYPPRGYEDPLLRDAIRTGIGLRTLAERQAAERRDHLAALASAPIVVLTHPVADIRAQRAAEPAPWLLEQTEPRQTSREEKATARASFQEAVCATALPAASASEFDIRLAIPAAPLDGTHPLVAALPALARGLAAARERHGGAFGPWTGGLTHPVPGLVTSGFERPLSATSLQEYAECPFRYFLASALGIRPVDEPDEDGIDAAERGTAVHQVLERTVRTAIEAGKPAGEPWSAAEHSEAHRLLDEHAARMLADGKAGHPTPWAVHVANWHRQLRRMMLADDAYRAASGARPVATEHPFGLRGSPPLVVGLPGAGIALRGSIDRVDETADGSLIVLDYKTGKSENYSTFPPADEAPGPAADFTKRGKRLQLPLYALAARRDFGGGAGPVRAFYWFVDEGATRRGGPVDGAAAGRFEEVLGVITDGITTGAFPARPGGFNAYYRSFENCRWCRFDRACSQARDDGWEQIRADPRVRRYAELAEEAEDGS